MSSCSSRGLGLTVAKGIAAGLTVVVPNGDGPYEIIQHGKLGHTFKKGDVDSLVNASQDIFMHYQERAERVVDAAYGHVKANYSIQNMVAFTTVPLKWTNRSLKQLKYSLLSSFLK